MCVLYTVLFTDVSIGRYNDPPYVKLKKLDLLTQVANDVNAQDIVEELG